MDKNKTAQNNGLINETYSNEGYLPIFPGFYGTIFEPYEEEIDDYFNDDLIEAGIDKDCEEAENIDIWDYFNNQEYEFEVCRQSVNIIEKELIDLGFIESCTFQKEVSPKEYNFSNDSIEVVYKFSKDNLLNIIKAIRENREDFKTYLKDRYTSCSGFWSHYSNKLKDWNYKTFIDDNHIFSSVLEFLLQINEIDSMTIYENLTDVSVILFVDTDKAVNDIKEEIKINEELRIEV